MEQKDWINAVFSKYCSEYKDILLKFEPWAKYENVPKSKSGDEYRFSIHESNQVVRFQSAYKEISEEAIIWVEFPIRYAESDTQDGTIHVDGIIADHHNKVIYFIEAKRLTKKQGFDYIADDIIRLVKCGKKEDLERRLNRYDSGLEGYTYYCLILADFWLGKNTIGKSYKVNQQANEKIDWGGKVLPYIKDKVVTSCKKMTPPELICNDILPVYWSGDKSLIYHLAYALFELEKF